jgi:N-methylhydantoinase B
MDGIQLEILWSNLISIVSEQARALQRIAFSPVVRDAGDLAVGMFDPQGRMVAQAVTGTPGHINSLAAAARNIMTKYPVDTLVDGDVLIVNDPWISAGHFFDITLLTPLFHKGRIIAFFGSTIHHTDIGGYGVGAGARDVHEEGLWIPITKLYEAGKPNETLHDIIRHNVRTPDAVFGDLAAQVSSARIGAERLIALCERQGMDDIDEVAEEIFRRSEEATRASIRALPGGDYCGECTFDIPGGAVIELKAKVTIDTDAGDILIDFTGSSGASPHGINVVMNYTHAYSTFAIRSTLNPDLPNNFGSISPIKVTAPEGCIVNAKYPSPVNARHVVGMYVPFPILDALKDVVPDRVIADSSGAVWTIQIQGRDKQGEAFTSSMFNYSGGMGARKSKDGPSATCYPTGVAGVPVEVLEASIPIQFTEKQLRLGSGGTGFRKGGDGQRIGFRMLTGKPWLLNAIPSRLTVPARGFNGGSPGETGRFLVSDKAVSEARKIDVEAQDVVILETPGGGGFGKA